MTTLDKQLAPHTLVPTRLPDTIVALILAGAALFVFRVFLIYIIPPKIIEQLYPFWSFGMPLNVFSQHVASLVFFSCVLLIAALLRVNILPLKFARGNGFQLLWCCAGVVVLFCLFHATLFVFGEPISQWERDYVFTPNQGLLVLFNTVLLAPANEELVFRGIIPFAVMNLILLAASPFARWQNPSLRTAALTVGMVLSSLVFAVMHHRGPVYDAYFFALGLWFGYWACKTSGLLIPVIGHSFAGLLAVGIIYLQNN